MDQVEEIKQKIDIVELVGGYVTLKQGGRNFKGLCPFHQEKSPSFMVNPEIGIYKCFGCGKGGDIFTFIQEIEGLEFPEALALLAERAGVKLKNTGRGENRSELEEMRSAHDQAAAYYHFLLTKHPVGQVARDYLKNRQITPALIERFQLGFALDSWDGLKKYLAEKKNFKPELLEKGGLLIRSDKGSVYDRFRARVMFPLRDHRGVTVGFAGRVIPSLADQREAKYINSPETPLYHKSRVLYGLFEAKQEIRNKDRVVLVEGELDMISSFAAGVGETVAIKGTALTEEHLKLLGRLTQNLVLALDADSAGDTAAKRSIALAEEAGMNVKVIKIEDAKDPDEIARHNPKQWRELVDKAVDIYEFYLSTSLKKHDPKTVEGKRRITAEVIPILAKITNQVVRGFYSKKLATVLSVGEESVNAEIDRVSRGLVTMETKTKPEVASVVMHQGDLIKDLLRLLWESQPSETTQAAKNLAGLSLPEAGGQLVLHWLEFDSGAMGEKRVIEFIKSLPPELKALAGEIYLESVDTTRLERDIETTLKQLVQQLVKRKLDQITVLIKQAEQKKDKVELKKLQGSFVQWSRRLS